MAADNVLKKLDVLGYRGFATRQSIEFGIPNGQVGSGLTIIVGPNNAGKSTVIEALRAFSSNGLSFTEGKRNKRADDRVQLCITYASDNTVEIVTVESGGSEVETRTNAPAGSHAHLIILPSRRYFDTYFGKSILEREHYPAQLSSATSRGNYIQSFAYRLFRILAHRREFNEVLSKVMDPVPTWTIDQSDSGQYFLKFETDSRLYHTSEGMGEGLVSLFFIVDALYDSKEGQVIGVDEPELSLHPALQRKVANLLLEYSATRQIIVATHSPYFAPLDAIVGGAALARVYQDETGSRIAQLSPATANDLGRFLNDLNNPHVFGLDAREVFFLNDGVIVVEGQEDVIFYRQMAQQLQLDFKGEFFGWGAGGAEKMSVIVALLKDLGFQRVVGILDGNKQDLCTRLAIQYPAYKFCAIPTNDVRSKVERAARESVEGMLTSDGRLQDQYRDAAIELINSVNVALGK